MNIDSRALSHSNNFLSRELTFLVKLYKVEKENYKFVQNFIK